LFSCQLFFSRSTGSNKDDGHQGTAMDYTECCRAQCTDVYANCDAVDSTMTVRNDQLYPNAAGETSQTECCYNTQCETWGHGGGTCTGDKVLRSDGHVCSDGSCDAEECCQDPPGCTGDGTTAASGKCKCSGALCNAGQYCWDGTTCNDAAKPSDGGDDGGGEDPQECKDAKAITHKDIAETGTDELGKHYKSQCIDLDTSPNSDDPSKWIAKEGYGSCKVCLDALKIIYGPKCENKDGGCKHCKPIIDAYADVSGNCPADSESNASPSPSKTSGSNSTDFGLQSAGSYKETHLIVALVVVAAAVMAANI